MGTGIVSTLTQSNAGESLAGAIAAGAFLVCGWILMIGFSIAFAIRVSRSFDVWTRSVAGSGAAAWGMVAMGCSATGYATATVVPTWGDSVADLPWTIHAILWTIGAVVGVITMFGFTFAMIRHRPTEPRPAWGLAIVPPMVTATTGAPFVARLDSSTCALALLVVLIDCFVASLTVGGLVFAAAIHHHVRVEAIPVALAASSWIPLGIVGQSAAAAQALSNQAADFLTPATAEDARRLADAFGVGMTAVAIPLVVFATITTARGFLARMPFNPGWWSLTFPVGTLSLGASALGRSMDIPGYEATGEVVWVVLLCTWTVVATASVRSVMTGVPNRSNDNMKSCDALLVSQQNG